MRKRLLSTLLMGVCALGLYAQPQVTVIENISSRLTNADFSADQPVENTIKTYDYDMEDSGLGNGESGLFGMQPVTGWTANYPSDNIKVMNSSSDPAREDGANARAAGVFAYLQTDDFGEFGLGGAYYPPYVTEENSGNALGMVSVWGAELKYTQDITLPAGGYMLIVKAQNVFGNELAANYNGFQAEGLAFNSSKVAFTLNEWENDTILFRLDNETAGQIVLGCSFGGGSGSAPHIFIDHVELYTIDGQYFVQVEIDKAKEELLALIEKGQDYGVSTDDAQTVYDNPNATLDEVLAAIEKQKELNEAGTVDLSAYFITNPHFSQDEPVEGGICTYGKDCTTNGVSTDNFSLLPVKGWTPNVQKQDGPAGGVFAIGSDAFLGGKDFKVPTSMSDGATEGRLLGIVTCWTATAQYTQERTLPAGRYTVGISYYNAGGAQAVAKNLIGFIDENGTEYLGETTTFPVGQWTSETITFELEEETTGNFTIGYTSTNVGSGNMPHLFVDGFSLVYIGTGIDASRMALTTAYTTASNAIDNFDRNVFNADLLEQLQTATEAAEELLAEEESDEEANKAATNAINDLMEKVNASIADYKRLNNFFEDELYPALEKYTSAQYPELNDELQGMRDNIADALSEGSWTSEEIDSTIVSLQPIIKTGVKKMWDAAIASGEKMDKDLDITALFDQMAYTYSTNVQQGANVPDKEWKYGSASNFKTQYGTAEVWNQSPFQVSRTLTDLPAGKYTITTKAFFRNADNQTNYDNYDEANTPEAYLFAGMSRTGLTNVAAIASEELAELPGAADLNGIFIPNTQQGAQQIFENELYDERLSKSVSTVIVDNNGELTFGVGADQMETNSWVIWYSFSIAYNAANDADLLAVLEGLDLQAAALQDEVANVTEADNKIVECQNAYQNSDNMSTEQLTALVAKYEEAIKYAQQTTPLISELERVFDLYTDYLVHYDTEREVVSDEPAYNALIEEAGNAKENGEYESNEQIQGWIDAFKNGWVSYVQYPFLNNSSQSNPGDITAAIYNYTFRDPLNSSEMTRDGWTVSYEEGKEDHSDGVWEFYNNKKFEISQTIKGLAEGYYLVRVQAFYRAGTSAEAVADSLKADPEYGRYAYIFAQTNDSTSRRLTPLKNIFQRENSAGELETGEVGVDGEKAVAFGDIEEFYVPGSRASFNGYAEADLYWNEVAIFVSAGEDLTIGLVKPEFYVANDWCPFDNFGLFYIGMDEPDGIEAIENGQSRTSHVAIYNLAGQRVAKAVKGLYIVNGKKVIVK